jgi:hypothetical protein
VSKIQEKFKKNSVTTGYQFPKVLALLLPRNATNFLLSPVSQKTPYPQSQPRHTPNPFHLSITELQPRIYIRIFKVRTYIGIFWLDEAQPGRSCIGSDIVDKFRSVDRKATVNWDRFLTGIVFSY